MRNKFKNSLIFIIISLIERRVAYVRHECVRRICTFGALALSQCGGGGGGGFNYNAIFLAVPIPLKCC